MSTLSRIRLARSTFTSFYRLKSTDSNGFIRIGDIKVPRRSTKNQHLVPVKNVETINANPQFVNHLKWLLQKDLLKQDVFLIGAPGSVRSDLVLQYLTLCNREYEYLPVTRDTTEADIKQRREIRAGSALYTDLCAVRAALAGRVLVIDGVERAERNVLPILNNLLENREMQLDDGRFLMPAEKYDKLLNNHSTEELEKMKLERVSPDFHVIALGLPVPAFKGHSLDPPLRSRFQCHHVPSLNFENTLKLCQSLAPRVSSDKITNLVAIAYAMNSQRNEGSALGLLNFPIDNLPLLASIWNCAPRLSPSHVFELAYPSAVVKSSDSEKQVLDDLKKKFDITGAETPLDIKEIIKLEDARTVKVQLNDSEVIAPYGEAHESIALKEPFVNTPELERLLAEMALSHSKGDFCILGTRGSGKTKAIEEFARRFGYHTNTVILYQDMNSRELVQQRRMLPNGDTIWEDSQLVESAKKGHLCVLDGIERVHWSSVEMIASLIYHRQLHLPDGSKLVGEQQFEKLKEVMELTEKELNERGVHKIPNTFRIIATGDDNAKKWLNDQTLSLFLFHHLKPFSVAQQVHIVTQLVPNCDKRVANQLLSFVHKLSNSTDAGIRGVAASLSLRKIINIMERHSLFKDQECIHDAISRAALSRFLPSITKTAFESALIDAGFAPKPADQKTMSNWKQKLIDIGAKRNNSAEMQTMVPDILFYDNKQHLHVMDDMAKDFQLGHHLLLIGNQGVGKNKITDRFLQLINRPRQYMQLHRDTTVQSLTVQSTVENGKLKYEDSPLVKAVREGLVLVIDEADKAPLHVIAVLKSLLDSGVLYLSDGRRIQPKGMEAFGGHEIEIHPDFRVIMLANRPGFPFLGNDLFGVLGDLLSVHIVDNPSRAEECSMLRKYGPDVSEDKLNKLVSAFDELRMLADSAQLSYPYSTRELVNIVKHVQMFPNDPLVNVVKNVFDFDAFSSDAMEQIGEIFHKHGIPLGVSRTNQVYLSVKHAIPKMTSYGTWGLRNNVVPVRVDVENYPCRISSHTDVFAPKFDLETRHMRSTFFSEQEQMWQLPLLDVNICSDVVASNDSENPFIAVATVNPPILYHISDPNLPYVHEIDLTSYFPYPAGSVRPRVKLCNIGNGNLLVHEENSDSLLLVNPSVNSVDIVSMNNEIAMLSSVKKSFRSVKKQFVDSNKYMRMIEAPKPLFFERGGNVIKLLNPESMDVTQLTLPENVAMESVMPITDERFLIRTKEDKRFAYYLLETKPDGSALLRETEVPEEFPDDLLNSLKEGENRYFQSDKHYIVKTDMFPDTLTEGSILASKRRNGKMVDNRKPFYANAEAQRHVHPQKEFCVLDGGLVVRGLTNYNTPEEALPKNVPVASVGGFIEMVDPKNNTVQYVPVPMPKYRTYHHNWVSTITRAPFVIVPFGKHAVLTCDTSGGIRKWELQEGAITKSYGDWQRMFGEEDPNLRVEYEKSETDFDPSKLDSPKIGKFDPDNTPHVGGNTWAGGTGGYNTAGLGGVGGPFRLDAGHDVHQMAQSAKDQVPEHILKKAREVAKAEYKKRLKEIDMSEYDADAYKQLYSKIERQATVLKNVIDSLEAKEKERQWVKHQMSGDFDDGKLIEGMTGEKAIYRRRLDVPPEPGSDQKKPKRLRLCFDVSGSMYRFNGYDNRLQRSMESALLCMEALHGKEEKIQYDLVGHSGDGPEYPFAYKENPPKNEKERLDILKKMLAHAQYCISGDYTLEALDQAIRVLAKESDVDERFVIAISDANLDRYGIRPKDVAKILEREETVNAFIIFIGSLGEQATRLQRALPPGKAFVAADTSQVPQIMQSIFSSTLIK
uniref:VWFA domain-containing protein n=1 Tax=Steinernema glaseri TaxID=37863 RepID=A0A1I7YH63_9BILA